MMTEKLARYGHHPDPAIDFEVEVESLQNIYADRHIVPLPDDFRARLSRALDFRAGGVMTCVNAKGALRHIDKHLSMKDPSMAHCRAARAELAKDEG